MTTGTIGVGCSWVTKARQWCVSSFRTLTGLLTLVIMSALPSLSAQEQVRLEGVQCGECELRTTLVATLGDINEEFSPAERPHKAIGRDSHGRFYVTGGYPAANILVYDPVGELLEVRGGSGEGPGEYRSIEGFILLEGDSVGVVDNIQRRLTVMAPDGTVARTLKFPVEPRDVVSVADGILVVSGLTYTAEGLGYPIHLVFPDGRTKKVEGEIPVLGSRPSASRRRLATDPSSVWAARPDRYEINRWNLDGEKLMLIDRVTPWFPDRDSEGAVNTAEERPEPFLIDLHLDEQGRLWTLLRVAARDWAPVTQGGSSSRLHRFDYIVEVIDPESRRLLVSERFSGYPHGFTNDGLIVTQTEGPFELLVLDVWKPTLVIPPGH